MRQFIDERNLVAAIASPMVNLASAEGRKQAKELHGMMTSTEKSVRQEAYDQINRKFEQIGNAIHYGFVEDDFKAFLPDLAITKAHDASFVGRSVRAYTFDLMSTLLDLDVKWMQFYNMVPAYGATEVDIATVTNIVRHKTYLDGQKIEAGPLASYGDTILREKRHGGATAFLQRWLTTNNLFTINKILQAHQVAEMILKADIAYSALANTSGVTTQAFTGTMLNTIQLGVQSLVTALLALQYTLTPDSQFLLLSNAVNMPAINAQLATLRGTDGNNPILEYNVQPVYTWNSNVSSDLGTGTASAMLIVAGVQNIWADFQPMKIGQEEDIASDSFLIVAQEYHNQQVVAAQKRVITLA